MASVLEDLRRGRRRGRPDGPAAASRAARLLGLAHATREAIGAVLAPCERPQHDRSVAAARGALGEAA